MFFQMFRLGLPVVAVGLLCPAGAALAQVVEEPLPTPAVPTLKSPAPRIISGMPGSAKAQARVKPQKVEDGDVWKKHPPPWSIVDPTPYTHPYASQAPVAPGIGAYPGGVSGQFGSPYYYTPSTPDTAFAPPVGLASFASQPYGVSQPAYGMVPPGSIGPSVGPVAEGAYDAGYAGGGFVNPGYSAPGYGAPGYGWGMNGGPAGVGYGGGGPAMAALPGNLPADPYSYHFGPGFYRYQEAGHYRFPYYSYRRPWYFPGHPSYNRDTNIPW